MFAKQHVSFKSERKLFRNQVPASMTDLVGPRVFNCIGKIRYHKKLIRVKVVKISMSWPMLCNNRTFGKIQ